MEACDQPNGYVANKIDFNNSSANAYPGVSEICSDNIDNDNDGFTDSDDFDCACK